jgi:uncharacterized iron-regulated membrane protein
VSWLDILGGGALGIGLLIAVTGSYLRWNRRRHYPRAPR